MERLEAYGEFDIKHFGDEAILHKPVTEWPTCDCLLSWHSDGFPLPKAGPHNAHRVAEAIPCRPCCMRPW